jgi:hypothetical protein
VPLADGPRSNAAAVAAVCVRWRRLLAAAALQLFVVRSARRPAAASGLWLREPPARTVRHRMASTLSRDLRCFVPALRVSVHVCFQWATHRVRSVARWAEASAVRGATSTPLYLRRASQTRAGGVSSGRSGRRGLANPTKKNYVPTRRERRAVGTKRTCKMAH